MRRRKYAAIARQTGWTINEVRGHSLGDLHAMTDYLDHERRAQRAQKGRK